MKEIVEFGTVSTKGQVAIPARIRKAMGLRQGSRIVFRLEKDTLVMREIIPGTWEKITAPLKEAAKRGGLTEEDVFAAIAAVRAKRRTERSVRHERIGRGDVLARDAKRASEKG